MECANRPFTFLRSLGSAKRRSPHVTAPSGQARTRAHLARRGGAASTGGRCSDAGCGAGSRTDRADFRSAQRQPAFSKIFSARAAFVVSVATFSLSGLNVPRLSSVGFRTTAVFTTGHSLFAAAK